MRDRFRLRTKRLEGHFRLSIYPMLLPRALSWSQLVNSLREALPREEIRHRPNPPPLSSLFGYALPAQKGGGAREKEGSPVRISVLFTLLPWLVAASNRGGWDAMTEDKSIDGSQEEKLILVDVRSGGTASCYSRVWQPHCHLLRT